MMYNLFYYNITKMTDELYSKEFSKLPLLRQKQLLKKANIDDRKRSLAGDILTKRYLSKLYGVREDAIEIKRGEHGKPYVLNLPAHFNVSHSGKYTILAISDKPIGIDIEIIEEFSAILAKKLFNEDELSYIAGNGPSRKKSEMQRSFYEIWTAKEAYLKYLGSGISGGVNTLSFSLKNSKLVPNKNDIKLTYDFSVPGAVTAIVTPND